MGYDCNRCLQEATRRRKVNHDVLLMPGDSLSECQVRQLGYIRHLSLFHHDCFELLWYIFLPFRVGIFCVSNIISYNKMRDNYCICCFGGWDFKKCSFHYTWNNGIVVENVISVFFSGICYSWNVLLPNTEHIYK